MKEIRKIKEYYRKIIMKRGLKNKNGMPKLWK